MADHRLLSALSKRGFAWLLVLGALLVLPACDSNDDNDLDGYDGTYTFTQLRFDVNGLDRSIDLLGRLDQRNTELIITAGEREFLLRYDLTTDSQSTLRLGGSVSRGSGRLRFDVNSGTPENLLLPQSADGADFSLEIVQNDDGIALRENIQRRGVDLTRYGINQTSIDGTLNVRLVRE